METKTRIIARSLYFLGGACFLCVFAYWRATTPMRRFVVCSDYPLTFLAKERIVGAVQQLCRLRLSADSVVRQLYLLVRGDLAGIDVWVQGTGSAVFLVHPHRPVVRVSADFALTQEGRLIERSHIHPTAWSTLGELEVQNNRFADPVEAQLIARWWRERRPPAELLEASLFWRMIWHDRTCIDLVPRGVADKSCGEKTVWRVAADTILTPELVSYVRGIQAETCFSMLDMRYAGRVIARHGTKRTDHSVGMQVVPETGSRVTGRPKLTKKGGR